MQTLMVNLSRFSLLQAPPSRLISLFSPIDMDSLSLSLYSLTRTFNSQRETGDTKYRPSILLGRMVAAGWMGKKSGKGFYDY